MLFLAALAYPLGAVKCGMASAQMMRLVGHIRTVSEFVGAMRKADFRRYWRPTYIKSP